MQKIEKKVWSKNEKLKKVKTQFERQFYSDSESKNFFELNENPKSNLVLKWPYKSFILERACYIYI